VVEICYVQWWDLFREDRIKKKQEAIMSHQRDMEEIGIFFEKTVKSDVASKRHGRDRTIDLKTLFFENV
jgi:hypothetical protein